MWSCNERCCNGGLWSQLMLSRESVTQWKSLSDVWIWDLREAFSAAAGDIYSWWEQGSRVISVTDGGWWCQTRPPPGWTRRTRTWTSSSALSVAVLLTRGARAARWPSTAPGSTRSSTGRSTSPNAAPTRSAAPRTSGDTWWPPGTWSPGRWSYPRLPWWSVHRLSPSQCVWPAINQPQINICKLIILVYFT